MRSRFVVATLIAVLTSVSMGTRPIAIQIAGGASGQTPSGDTVGTVFMPAGRIARGPLLDTPAPAPPVEADDHEPLSTPLFEDRVFIPPSQTAETADAGIQPRVPGTSVVARNTTLTPPSGYTSSVAEPNVGTQGDGIFMTHNWYGEVSTNNGSSFSYVSPYTLFPNTPAEFSSGFCCDQRVAQDPSHDLIFWLLQYVKTGSTSSSTNGYRIAVAHGQADLATNTWQYHDFMPATFGLPSGKWLDFPHLQVSSNYLYFTANVFETVNDLFYAAVIGRIPLAALSSNTAFTMNTFVTTGFGSIAPVNGATSTMYFASTYSSTSLKVLTWPEANSSPTVNDVTGLSSTGFTTFSCPGPDGLNTCGRANPRVQTGWVTATELGFMWGSSQDGSHAHPYTRVVILSPSTLAVVSQPDIFSSTSAFLYPAVAVNARGHLGGTIDRLGGTLYTSLRAIIRDDFSPDVTTSGWELIVIADGNSGTSSRWGDYNGVVAHEKYPNTWVGVGHVQQGTSDNSGSSLRNFWFMRERDVPGTGDSCSSVQTSAVPQSITPTAKSPSGGLGAASASSVGSAVSVPPTIPGLPPGGTWARSERPGGESWSYAFTVGAEQPSTTQIPAVASDNAPVGTRAAASPAQTESSGLVAILFT